jgi:hypothetical protein
MLDVLRENLLAILAVVIPIAVSYYFYRKTQKRIKFLYEVASLPILASKRGLVPEEIKIIFKKKNISKLSRETIVFWNDGNDVVYGNQVTKDDPIRIVFGYSTQILAYEILKRTQDTNKFRLVKYTAKQKFEKYAVKLDFEYLDPKDGVVIDLWHDDNAGHFRFEGTLIGVNKAIGLHRKVPRRSILRRVTHWMRGSDIPLRMFQVIILLLCVGSVLAWAFAGEETVPLAIKYFLRSMLFLSSIYIIVPSILHWYVRHRYPMDLQIDNYLDDEIYQYLDDTNYHGYR